MKENNNNFKVIKWTARIIAIAVIGFGLPFYFGYGNPLPFINPQYTIWDNMWLTILSIVFIALPLGLKLEGVMYLTVGYKSKKWLAARIAKSYSVLSIYCTQH